MDRGTEETAFVADVRSSQLFASSDSIDIRRQVQLPVLHPSPKSPRSSLEPLIFRSPYTTPSQWLHPVSTYARPWPNFFSFLSRTLMAALTGPPLLSTRPRCRIRFLPPIRHHCCRQAPREPEVVRAQAVPHQPGPSRVPEEDCSPEQVWWYVASRVLSPCVNQLLTRTTSRFRPQRPQVRPGILAQVGPIDNSPCIFSPIDPAILPYHEHTRRMPVF